MPSRKWFLALTTMVVGNATGIITSGWDQATQIALITSLGTLVGSYIIPNGD